MSVGEKSSKVAVSRSSGRVPDPCADSTYFQISFSSISGQQMLVPTGPNRLTAGCRCSSICIHSFFSLAAGRFLIQITYFENTSHLLLQCGMPQHVQQLYPETAPQHARHQHNSQ